MVSFFNLRHIMNIEKVLMIKEGDVLRYLNDHKLLRQKTRKRAVIDPRNFLINILYYRFNWSEHRIGALIGRDHSAVNQSKNNAYYHWEDEAFIRNTQHVRRTFPEWLPPEPKIDHRIKNGRKLPITIKLTKLEYDRLNKLRKKFGHRNFSSMALKIVLDNISKYE